MFERYTERARRVLFFARYEASQLGSISIETEHLLLGLIREGKGLTSRLFARQHISLDSVRQEIEGRTVFHEKISTSVEIPFSADMKRVLQFAVDEADRLLHNYIGTEHLLLGILRDERSVAAIILIEKGMRLQSVRDDIEQLLNEKTTLRSVTETPLHSHDFPQYLPSDTVHISISRRESQDISEGPRHWTMLGVDLATAMAQACGIDPVQLILPGQLEDGPRYDLVLAMPSDTSVETLRQIVSRALEKQFGVTMSREAREGGEVVVVRLTQP